MKCWPWFLFLLTSCAPSSLKELHYEGEVQTHKLALQLRKIETKEDLQKALPKLKKRFNRIADLLIQVRKYSNSEKMQDPSSYSEELFIEMARLYELPGGKELIESAQAEAVRKLFLKI